jgi:hypothetical protein
MAKTVGTLQELVPFPACKPAQEITFSWAGFSHAQKQRKNDISTNFTGRTAGKQGLPLVKGIWLWI